MPEAVLVGQQAYEIVRGVSAAFAGGASLSTGPLAVSNYARLTAVFAIAAGGAPASGYPRLVQSVDGSTTDLVTVATQDTTQLPTVVYTLDVALLLPYAQVEFTNGAGATTVNYLVQGWPSGASGSSSGGGSSSSAITGEVKWYSAATVPSGYLACDGTVYNIATYPTLGALLGSTWGGNGTTTFGVPDLRGRSPLGSGTGSGLTARTLGQTGGEENHVLSTGELAAHSHGVTDPGHSHDSRRESTTPGIQNLYATAAIITNGLASTSVAGPNTTNTTGVTVGSTGSDTGHNTMHPFAVLTPIIKT